MLDHLSSTPRAPSPVTWAWLASVNLTQETTTTPEFTASRLEARVLDGVADVRPHVTPHGRFEDVGDIRRRASARSRRTPQAERDQSAVKAISESGPASAIARARLRSLRS